MRDLGVIQAELMDRLKKAAVDGNGHELGVLGPAAAEMERKGAEWESLLNVASGGPATQAQGATNAGSATPQHNGAVDFEGRHIYAVTILGFSVPVGSYKAALFAVTERLQAAHPDFDLVAPRVRGNGPYFSDNKSDLRRGEPLKNSKLFMETNLGSNRIWEVCRQLVRTFGHNPDDPSVLHFDAASQRTRMRNQRGERRP